MIWCVDDDSSIREIEVYALQSAGYEAEGFADGASLEEALKTRKPELLILDIMMPGEDGITILKKLKNHPAYKDIPVIMATAKGMEFDVIQGLEQGADDYLSKPFGIMEMVARVKAVLRRFGNQRAGILKAGGIELDPEKRTVTADEIPVQLTYKEFELLKLFLSHKGVAFTRENLLQSVWETDFYGESRTVDMHIKTLRKKLGNCGSMIKTVVNVGYRLEDRE